MLIASVSDFRKDIKRYLDKVSKNFETLIINRGNDSGIVVMSLEVRKMTRSKIHFKFSTRC